MIHIGDIVLADGRVVHGRVVVSYEWDTNAVNILRVDLSWAANGEDLTADEYNEVYAGLYLHEYVTDCLLLIPGEYDDE